MHDTIRVWKSTEQDRCGWHVSVGDASTRQELRRLVTELELEIGGEPVGDGELLAGAEFLGMTWDEMLETVAVAMIAPGTLRGPRSLGLEPPVGPGWMLTAELQPLGGGEFRILSREAEVDRLMLGEALAQVVYLTYPDGWTGWRSTARSPFALVRAAG